TASATSFQENGRKKGATIATAWAAKKGIELHRSSFSSSPLARARASFISRISGGWPRIAASGVRDKQPLSSRCHGMQLYRSFDRSIQTGDRRQYRSEERRVREE